MKHFQKFNLRQKIMFSMMLLVASTSLLIFIFVTISSQRFMKTQSINMALQQLKISSYSVEQLIKTTEESSQQISFNSWIQTYLRMDPEQKGYTIYERNSNEVISNQLNSNFNFDFIALLDTKQDRPLYTGSVWTIPNFTEKIKLLYQDSQPLNYGYMTYILTPNIFHPEEYSFYFFQPIYDQYQLNSKIGLLVFSIAESNLQPIFKNDSNMFSSTYIIDHQGYILSSNQKNRFLQQYPYFSNIQNDSGSFQIKNKNMIIYNKISSSSLDWYLVSEIPTKQLHSDYNSLLIFVLFGIIISLIVCVFSAYIISNTMYKPFKTILQSMSEASSGSLSVRITSRNCGEDIQKINDGFNDMLDKINKLIIQVKEEQHQIEMIRFNALQSQIQPHFLYNTLDSIHWQALYNKDQEVSLMVKHLAKYYRICLSQGNDIISLQDELDMTEAYITIQNIRYDNLIEYHFDIPSIYQKIAIPKLSLQPLIENAIYHGFRPKETQHGKIWITAFQDNQDFILQVSDDGMGMNQDKLDNLNDSISIFNEQQGYGLSNVHRRIEIYYGIGYGLYFTQDKHHHTVVEIRLPMQFIDENKERM